MGKSIHTSEIKTIILACEAGIGSSLMSVNSLKKKFRKAGVKDVNVIHKATATIPASAKFIICHNGIKESVRLQAPDAVIVGFKMFFNDPIFDKIVKAFVDGTEIIEK
jgi:mannitol-specific phosphotransferase system IIBC component